jgi:hypothetical protein
MNNKNDSMRNYRLIIGQLSYPDYDSVAVGQIHNNINVGGKGASSLIEARWNNEIIGKDSNHPNAVFTFTEGPGIFFINGRFENETYFYAIYSTDDFKTRKVILKERIPNNLDVIRRYEFKDGKARAL